ncbi:hypothetical protein HMPREF0765_3948 [Sphingobacterium spiritivorum ATCC 33300]|uniref:Uncharacterized protein n=1 Tax=Sphingobacterium spiritivorum ATCC 33300 TaxID=525372 RepID=C2G2Z2_SPHSI|nr:hypothetical protein HMPREF0765_3948 [Sphingobacterium spiritivorum ATCC 33300]
MYADPFFLFNGLILHKTYTPVDLFLSVVFLISEDSLFLSFCIG